MLKIIILRLKAFIQSAFSALQPSSELALENLALRQQMAVLKKENPRPRVTLFDRLSWVWMFGCWAGWKDTLIIVNPETVIGWHRRGFRIYWNFI